MFNLAHPFAGLNNHWAPPRAVDWRPKDVVTTWWEPGESGGSANCSRARPTRGVRRGWFDLAKRLREHERRRLPNKADAFRYVNGDFRTDDAGNAWRSNRDTISVSALRIDIDEPGTLTADVLCDFLDKGAWAAIVQERAGKFHVHIPLARPFWINGGPERATLYRKRVLEVYDWFESALAFTGVTVDRSLATPSQVFYAYAIVPERTAPKTVYTALRGLVLDFDGWTLRESAPEASRRRQEALGVEAIPEAASKVRTAAATLLEAAGAHRARGGEYERWTCPYPNEHGAGSNPNEDCAYVTPGGQIGCHHTHRLDARLREDPDPAVALAHAEWSGARQAVRGIGAYRARAVPAEELGALAVQESIREALDAWAQQSPIAFAPPPGVGKTRVALEWALNEALKRGISIAFASPTHAAADAACQQARDMLASDLGGRVVRVRGSLVGCEEQKPDLAARLKALGASPSRDGFCGLCSAKDTCSTGPRATRQKWEAVRVGPCVCFVTHAMIPRAVEAGVSLVVIDENVSPVVHVDLTEDDDRALDAALEPDGIFTLALGGLAEKIRELRGAVGGVFAPDPGNLISQLFAPLDHPAVGALAKLVTIARAGVRTEVQKEDSAFSWRWAPPSIPIVFLSATPDLGVLAALGVHAERIAVRDHTPTSRTWHCTTKASAGTFRRHRREWESLFRRAVVPLVHGRRALVGVDGKAQAARAGEILEAEGVEGVDVVYQAILEGRNEWQGFDVFVSFGDMIPNVGAVRADGVFLGLDDPEGYPTRRAENNLEQFHGRARTVSPWVGARVAVELVHFGNIAPGGWHSGNSTVVPPALAGRPREDRAGERVARALRVIIEREGVRGAGRLLGCTDRTVRRWRVAGVPERRTSAVLDGVRCP